MYYEDWIKKSKESENHLEFQKLWELVMVRSSSEAICETVGSIMGQHCGKNRYITPENFSKELVLRFNLGPLHLLNGLIDALRPESSENIPMLFQEADQCFSKQSCPRNLKMGSKQSVVVPTK